MPFTYIIDKNNNIPLKVNSDGSIDSNVVSSVVGTSVTSAIDSNAYDLNAAAFSEVTDISSDYILDNIEFNFSTAESKTITVTSGAGTVIWSDTNTDTSVFLSNMNIAFNSNENITVTVTQFSSAGTMDCILRVK